MKRNEKGQVLVLVALAIFVLLGFAALGIDVGYMYSVRHELQRSADAGALAGASAFLTTGMDSTDDTTTALATQRATDYATRDKVSTSPLLTVTGDVVSVTFPTDTNKMRVKVFAQRTGPLFFARVFGRDNAVISATAVAEAYTVSRNVRCLAPWGIPAPWTESGTSTPGQFDSGDTVNWPKPGEDPCKNLPNDFTQWDTTTHDIKAGTQRSLRDQFLCQGSLQVLKIGDPNGQPIPGNFFGMDLSGLVGKEGCPGMQANPGANFYSWMILHSCDCDIQVATTDYLPIDTKPGEMVQKTISPVAPDSYTIDPRGAEKPYLPFNVDPDSLMNRDPNATWNTNTDIPGGVPGPPDGTYDNNWSLSRRIIKIPIYNPNADSNSGLNTPTAGRSTFQPLGFAGFWIQDVQYWHSSKDNTTNGTIVGRFVTVGGLGAGEEDSEDTSSRILNIRLVE